MEKEFVDYKIGLELKELGFDEPCFGYYDHQIKELDTILTMPKLVVGHMDVDEEENEKLLKKYKVESLPTQIFIKLVDNKVTELSRIEGYDYTKLKMEYNKYSSQ